MKQYFDSGIIDEMVAIGLITYEDMIDSVIDFEITLSQIWHLIV